MFIIKSIAYAGAIMIAAPAVAHAGSRSSGSPWEGTWDLVAAYDLMSDGSHAAPYGKAPQGRMIVDDDGRYMIESYGDTPLPFAAGAKAKGTADEFRAAVMSASVHYGRVDTDAAACTLIFHIERAAYPNWNGVAQTRAFSFDGTSLSYTQPRTAETSSAPVTVWRRLTEPAAPALPPVRCR